MREWYTKPPVRTEAEIDLFMRQVEVQLDEYEVALRAYGEWLIAWRRRQKPAGFRRAKTEAG